MTMKLLVKLMLDMSGIKRNGWRHEKSEKIQFYFCQRLKLHTQMEKRRKLSLWYGIYIYSIPVRDKIDSVKIDVNIDVINKLLAIENIDDIEKYMRVFE